MTRKKERAKRELAAFYAIQAAVEYFKTALSEGQAEFYEERIYDAWSKFFPKYKDTPTPDILVKEFFSQLKSEA